MISEALEKLREKIAQIAGENAGKLREIDVNFFLTSAEKDLE